MDVLIAASSGAIAGLISGVVGSLIAPWVQWAVEKRRNRQNYRRELIQSWRDTVTAFVQKGNGPDRINQLSETPEYSMMKAYLNSESRHWIEVTMAETYDSIREDEPEDWRLEVAGKRKIILDELARLEQKWGLV